MTEQVFYFSAEGARLAGTVLMAYVNVNTFDSSGPGSDNQFMLQLSRGTGASCSILSAKTTLVVVRSFLQPGTILIPSPIGS